MATHEVSKNSSPISNADLGMLDLENIGNNRRTILVTPPPQSDKWSTTSKLLLAAGIIVLLAAIIPIIAVAEGKSVDLKLFEVTPKDGEITLIALGCASGALTAITIYRKRHAIGNRIAKTFRKCCCTKKRARTRGKISPNYLNPNKPALTHKFNEIEQIPLTSNPNNPKIDRVLDLSKVKDVNLWLNEVKELDKTLLELPQLNFLAKALMNVYDNNTECLDFIYGICISVNDMVFNKQRELDNNTKTVIPGAIPNLTPERALVVPGAGTSKTLPPISFNAVVVVPGAGSPVSAPLGLSAPEAYHFDAPLDSRIVRNVTLGRPESTGGGIIDAALVNPNARIVVKPEVTNITCPKLKPILEEMRLLDVYDEVDIAAFYNLSVEDLIKLWQLIMPFNGLNLEAYVEQLKQYNGTDYNRIFVLIHKHPQHKAFEEAYCQKYKIPQIVVKENMTEPDHEAVLVAPGAGMPWAMPAPTPQAVLVAPKPRRLVAMSALNFDAPLSNPIVGRVPDHEIVERALSAAERAVSLVERALISMPGPDAEDLGTSPFPSPHVFANLTPTANTSQAQTLVADALGMPVATYIDVSSVGGSPREELGAGADNVGPRPWSQRPHRHTPVEFTFSNDHVFWSNCNEQTRSVETSYEERPTTGKKFSELTVDVEAECWG